MYDSIDDVEVYYTYNADGIRTQKYVNGVTTYYTLDGSKIISQKTGNIETFFEYDATGNVISMTYNNNTYYYVRNIMGDIIGITDANGNLLVTYTYDPYGNLIGFDYDTNEGWEVGYLNPFCFKGYYFDNETGFYYCNSRYYDPELCRFLNADGEISGSGNSVHGYNLFAYCFNNPVNLDDANGNWPKWAKKIVAAAAVVAVVAVVATVAVATCGAGSVIACAAVGAAKGAAVGFVTGAATGALSGAVEHRLQTGSWDGAGEAALNGMADGALSGSISGAVTGAVTSNACFVAGTAVLTSVGYVAIENIQSGDYVWATDPDTGETELKEVVQTFVNDAHELVYVCINGEVIKCTNEHPFYSPVRGWTAACDLRAGDVLVLVNGEYVVVERVEHYILESPIKVYNFEVAGFHTYYVGEQSVLVHNLCKPGRTGKQAKLRELVDDDKLSSSLRGEIKRDINEIARGKRNGIRVPQGYNLAHKIGYSAKDGFGYAYSQLQPIAMHLLHHKIFGYK